MKKIHIEEFKYNLFESTIKGSEGLTIIIYHGWGTRVESFNDLAVELTKIGHTVIVPEIIFHDHFFLEWERSTFRRLSK